MEIQRYGDDHLEITIDALTADGQKQEIEALDQVVRNWEDKCKTAESCAISLLGAPSQTAILLPVIEEKVNALDSLHKINVSLDPEKLPEDESDTAEIEGIDEKRSHLKDLIMLAIVDGQFDQDEQDTILQIGLKMGFTERRVNSLYNECVLNPDQIESISPNDPDEKLQYLTNLCRVILADGKIADWESVLIVPLAVKMGFDSDDVSKTLAKLMESDS